MTLDVSHADYAGGGPGFVLVRVTGRAHDVVRCRLAPPALLIADGAAWRRLAAVAGTAPLEAGPDSPAFSVDFEVPLHLAVAGGAWWLEPGPPIAEHRGPTLEDLRARLNDLRGDVAALRARVEAADQAPAAQAVSVPRPRARGLRPGLPAVLVAAGALAVGDAVATVAWQEPLTALWSTRQQHALQGDLVRLDRSLAASAPALPATAAADPQARMRTLAGTLERASRAGRPLGELRIPRIGADYVVVQGTSAGSLRRGPGHYLGTALPGEAGTVGIAGHRTTYGAPFRHVDALRRGDPITLTMPYGTFVYRVEGTRIVRPEDASSLRAGAGQRLVLTACHPLYSAAKRIVVLARLERAIPRGAAAAPTPPASAPPAGGAGAAPAQQA
jgi:sortase A